MAINPGTATSVSPVSAPQADVLPRKPNGKGPKSSPYGPREKKVLAQMYVNAGSTKLRDELAKKYFTTANTLRNWAKLHGFIAPTVKNKSVVQGSAEDFLAGLNNMSELGSLPATSTDSGGSSELQQLRKENAQLKIMIKKMEGVALEVLMFTRQ